MTTSFIQHLQKLVLSQPDKPAFIFLANGEAEQGRLSYAELDQQARNISAYLQQHSQVGDRIVLCYLPGLEFVTAFLGCLYAGRTVVPAYPLRNNHHAKRLLAILEDCDPALILGTQDSLSLMQAQTEFAHYRYVLPEEFTENYTAKPAKLIANTLAFLQYTSGSTGTPKGVMVSHGNILANLEAIHHFYALTDKDNIVSWLPMQHDMGLIGQLLYTLYCGTTEIFMPPAAFLEKPIRWLQAITRYQGYAAGGPNFGFALCVERVTAEQLAELDLRAWKIAFNGSEPIRAETLHTFAEKFKSCGFKLQQFLPCYGMAETTLLVSGKPHTAVPVIPRVDKQQVVSSGQIYKTYTAKIVNPQTKKLVKAGEAGEIWVSGPSVAQGYWNRKNDTTFKAKLINDKKTYLRTGDLAYLDGKELYITGRLKDLIILQGKNLYPQDIEAAAESCTDAIRAGCTAAFSVEVNQQEQVVIIAEIKRTHRKIDFQPVFKLIRQAVLQTAEVIPYSIHLIAPAKALRTTSGKIQRQATKAAYLAGTLDSLAIDDLDIAEATQNTTQQLEQDITALLQKLFAIEAVDPQKSFALMGGTSLEAIILQQQLQSYVGNTIKLPTTLVFDYPTVRDLAAYLHTRLNEKIPVNVMPAGIYHDAPQLNLPLISKADRNTKLPLSLNERAAWIADQEKAGNAYLNMKMLVFIEQAIDHDPLSLALKKVTGDHEILRTSYHQDNTGKLYRQLHQQVIPILEFHDLSMLDNNPREQRLTVLAQDVEHTVFKLDALPLFRFILVKITQEKFALIFSMHHIIGDGMSVGLLIAELLNNYQAIANKKTLPNNNPDITYTDYANWQQQAHAAGCFTPLLNYWEQQLSAVEDLMLPYDKLKTTFTHDAAGIITIHLNTKQIASLKTFANTHKLSLYALFMGALQLLLNQQTLQNKFLLETILSNRTNIDRKSMLGALAIDAVVLYQLNDQTSVVNFLTELLAQTLALNQLLQDCGPLIYNAASKINPRQPTVGINYHAHSVEIIPDRSISMDASYFARQSLPGNLDLFLEIWPARDKLVVDFVYRQAVFRKATLENMVNEFFTILEFFLQHPQAKLADYKE